MIVWSFGKCARVGCPETWRIDKKLTLQHLLRYADGGEDMLNRTVTGDESWVYHYQPQPKHASMQWKHPSSPSCSTKMFKVMSMPSAGKDMLTVFWDSQGVPLAHFQDMWWKYEFYIVLWSSVEASGCNSQQTSRPTSKRGTVSSWQC
jgi:hypothetical protein